MRALINKLTSSVVGRNTAWAMLAEALQLGLGSVAFFLLGGRIGPEEFGVYGAIIAIATLSIPLASVGARAILMIDLTAGAPFGLVWSRAITTVLFGGVASTLTATLLAQPLWFSDVGLLPFAALFGSQACFFAMSEFALVSTEANRRLLAAVGIRLVSGVARLLAVVVFIALGEPTVRSFAWFAVAGSATATVTGLAVVGFVFKAWPRLVPPTTSDLRRGFPFALGWGSASILDAADRPMLLELGSAADAGNYNAGYRIAQLGAVPIAALVKASDADFYSAGQESRKQAAILARRLSMRAGAYGVFAAIVLYLAAPLAPLLLGSEWESTQRTIRLLAVLPLIRGLQTFPANALTGSDQQSKRNLCVGVALVANVATNFALIPRFGLDGAVVATLFAESLMAGGLWYFVMAGADGDTETKAPSTETRKP